MRNIFLCKRMIVPTMIGLVILIGGISIRSASAQTDSPPTQIPLSGIVSISAKSSGTCGITETGGVECWGSYQGATNILGVSDAVTLEGGVNHTCSITKSGEVKCWGANDYGQLGDQTSEDTWMTAVGIKGLPDKATALAAGFEHTCAIVNGDVFCWGGNSEGQLGDGTTTDHSLPAKVIGLPVKAMAIGIGFSNTCAVLIDGSVWCWGGYGFSYGSFEYTLTPVKINGLPEDVSSVDVGRSFACVLTNNGSIWCWGDNSNGQLGDGTTESREVLVEVKGLTGSVTSFSVGDEYVCALINGGVACWGDNRSGQLGDGTNTDRSTPVIVMGLTEKVIDIATSQEHTCALLESGEVRCWGHGGYGELGNGIEPASHTPVNVIGLEGGISGLFAGGTTTCVIENGNVLCWGSNDYGELGDGTDLDRSVPVSVQGLDGKVRSLAIGRENPCAITDSGVQCWGFGLLFQRGNVLDGIVTSTAAGDGHNCAVTNNGAIFCWGYNGYGQLGDGTTEYRESPVQVSGLNGGVMAIAAGGYHTCAATGNGVFCWGDNNYGQLGDGTTENRSIPVRVNGLGSGVIALAASETNSCALTDDGKVLCWGNNENGQLGDGTQTDSLTPVMVNNLPGKVIALVSGNWHSCALIDSGGVVCWGDNYEGELGDGTTEYRESPVQVSGLDSGVIALASGEFHTCALTASAVKCWGSNSSGQLGNGIDPYSLVPVTVIIGPRRGVASVPAATGGFRPASPLVPQITTYIPTPLDVSTQPGVIGTNLFLAALIMLPFSIAADFFTRVMSEHEESLWRNVKLVDWIVRLKGRLFTQAGTRLNRHPTLTDTLKLLGVMFFYGLIFSLLDRTWNPFSLKGLILFLSMTITYGIVGIADDIMQFRTIRKWGLPAELNLRPTNILIALLSTATTRLFSLVPGLMFGTPEALQAEEALFDQDKRNRLLKISAITLSVVGLSVWFTTAVTGLLQHQPLPEIPMNLIAGLEGFLLIIYAVTLENVFVQVLGFAGSFGEALKRKNRWLWLAVLIGVTFLFYHTLLNPRGELAAALQEGNVIFFLGVATAFIVGTFGLRMYYWWQERRSAGLSKEEPATVVTAPESEIPPTAVLQTGSIPTANVTYPGTDPSPFIRLRCEKCDITRFEILEDVEVAQADEIIEKTKADMTAIPPGDYVKACLTPRYQELPETRTHSDPAFSKALNAVNNRQYAQVIIETETLLLQYPDWATFHYWRGSALFENGYYAKARSELMEALEKTNEKYPLCNLLGKIELKKDNLVTAVYWWAQALHCQETLAGNNYGGDVDPYLYLSYVAEGMGLVDMATELCRKVDQIRTGQIQLAPDTAQHLRSLVQRTTDSKVKEVLERLGAMYFGI